MDWVGLRWLYFDAASLAAEHRLAEAHGQTKVRLALEAYTYGHFPSSLALVLILAALIVAETTRYAQIRRNLRGASSPASS